jgi:hypothetical protein
MSGLGDGLWWGEGEQAEPVCFARADSGQQSVPDEVSVLNAQQPFEGGGLQSDPGAGPIGGAFGEREPVSGDEPDRRSAGLRQGEREAPAFDPVGEPFQLVLGGAMGDPNTAGPRRGEALFCRLEGEAGFLVAATGLARSLNANSRPRMTWSSSGSYGLTTA